MIAAIKGRLVGQMGESLLIDIGALVLRVFTSGTTIAEAGEPGAEIRLHTHLHVREDQIGRTAPHLREGLDAVVGFRDAVAGIFQGCREETPDGRIVVDNEDGRGHRSPSNSSLPRNRLNPQRRSGGINSRNRA